MINAICYVFISILLMRAVYMDVLWGRIENWVVGIGMAGGMTYLVMTKGSTGMWNAGKHVFLLGLVLYVLYWIRGLGAGDVKLLVMAGMWMPQYSFQMAAGAFFIGAGIACGRMLIRWIRRQQVYIRGETIPFAVPIACSFAGCLVLGGRV